MELPDGSRLIVAEGTLVEPNSGGRVALWVGGEPVGKDRMWHRLSIPARAAVTRDRGVCFVEVVAIELRQRQAGRLARLFGRGAAGKGDRSLIVPTGEAAEPTGRRWTDRRLAWSGDPARPLDRRALADLFPQAEVHREIGPNLLLVGGIGPGGPGAGAPPATPTISLDASPRELAESALAGARRSGDLAGEVDALVDLGAALLKGPEAPRAAEVLREAVGASRRLGDPARRADALTHLGMAMLALRRPSRARMLFRPALNHARKVGDRFAEKLVLEHLALAQIGTGEAEAALESFERARALSVELGDGRQEARVLWRAAILLAEMGRRDRAVASAWAAVAAMRRDGDPAAEWYAHHLDQFRGGGVMAGLGGVIDSGPGAPPDAGAAGPGWLRMALTAAQAMRTFVGSGFKTTAPEAHRARLSTCSACEHHTGVRCRLCGCLTVVKAKMLHERCPAGRWPT